MRIYRDAGTIPVAEIEKARGLTWNGVPVTAILQTASILPMQPDPGFADDNNYFLNTLIEESGLNGTLPEQQVVLSDGTDITKTVEDAVALLKQHAF